MKSLFRSRRQEHVADVAQRNQTAQTLSRHREAIQSVRGTLRQADETLGDEIRRLDRALEDARAS